MGTKDTVAKPNKFTQSVGAGMKSVFGGGGRTYYILEHKVTSERHHAGEHQEIIIDYIELGRDSKCQVRFGESFPTVSRRHAAITKEGNNWVLQQLSTSNPTLINGRPIAKQFFLQNGDEIQLSMEGPKLGFLIPVQNSVKSIGMTRRLSLFRQQALRPYKQALTVISLVFLLAFSALGFFSWQQYEDGERYKESLNQFAGNVVELQGNADSLQRIIAENNATQNNLKTQLEQLQETVRENEENRAASPSGAGNQTPGTVDLNPLFASVYFIYVEKLVINFQDQSEEITDYQWSGTGFLLDNKTFITARHVIESWSFFTEDDQIGMTLNMIENNGGSVVAHFTAYSPDGSTISFKSTDFNFDRSGDESLQTNDNDGNTVLLKKAKLDDGKDWASYATNKTGRIELDTQLANNLEQQSRLHILGYPLGLGANSANDISPIYGNCIVSSSGLQNGLIYVTDRNFEHGNSGGPVFILKDNKYYAIGIVSAGTGDNTGFIVPVSAVR